MGLVPVGVYLDHAAQLVQRVLVAAGLAVDPGQRHPPVEQAGIQPHRLAGEGFRLAEGPRIAVAGGDGSGAALAGDIVCTPCGGCRQAIYEASCLSGRDVEIICSNGGGSTVERHRISTLIPHGFGPANLEDAG